jgi:predicted Zn finger-like uncharacterized protein
MIEIQCTSCQTRYRIDERILPDDTPTFKCSRCGHVFSAEPRQKAPRRAGAERARAEAASAEPAVSAKADAGATAPPASPSADASAATPSATRQAAPSPQPPPAEPQPAQAPRQEPQKVRDATQELLQRRFGNLSESEDDRPGENLSFDFNDEPGSEEAPAQGYPEERWEVGDTGLPPAPPPRPKPRIRISDIDDDLVASDAGLDRPFARRRGHDEPLDADEEQDFERIRPEEVSAQAHQLEAELRSRAYKVHSAGYFLGLFAMVVVGFGLVTMVIQSAPIVSAGLLSALPIVGAGLEPPISPAQRVALAGVQAQYVKLKGNQPALVVSGTAENLTTAALGAVQIEAALTASGAAPLRTQAVYCGNSVTPKALAEMTPHEIEFFEKLDAPKNFTLAPQATTPFVIVFIAPPAGAAHFQLRIVRADPAAAPPAPASEGG